MKTTEKLKQELESNEDYQTLVTAGVMPHQLRWEPQFSKDLHFFEEDGKSVLKVTLSARNYPDGPETLHTSRTARYTELLTEDQAIEQFPDEGWQHKQRDDWENQQLQMILSQL